MISHFSDTFKDLLKWPAMYDLFDRIFGEENDPLQGVDLKSEIAKTVKAAVKVTEDDLPAFFAENFQVLFKSFLSFIKLMLIYLFAVEMERLSMQKKLFCVCVY